MSTPEINDGGPAFPMSYHPDGNNADHQGMPLRDWLAGQALSHIGNEYVACGDITPQAKDHAMTLAVHAYNIADAMIAARKKGGAE